MAIEVERCKRVNDCHRDMFAAWLQMSDKVSTVGQPSWSVLKAALKRIGEKKLPNRIVMSCELVCAINKLSLLQEEQEEEKKEEEEEEWQQSKHYMIIVWYVPQ